MPWHTLNAGEVLRLVRDNREHLRQWEPRRDAAYFTLAGQRALLAQAAAEHARGTEDICGVRDLDARLVGRVALTGIERGPFRSCHLGYFIDHRFSGRGHATAAVRLMLRRAFDELGLHRVEAACMPANLASIRVLRKCGFRTEGLARSYLCINGVWEDHRRFAVTATR